MATPLHFALGCRIGGLVVTSVIYAVYLSWATHAKRYDASAQVNIRSNGCVYLNTIEVNLWYGSSEIYNRSRGMS